MIDNQRFAIYMYSWEKTPHKHKQYSETLLTWSHWDQEYILDIQKFEILREKYMKG